MDNSTLKALRDLGVEKVVIGFSGGNDEGGADSLVATKADGAEVSIPDQLAYERTEYRDGRWVSVGWEVYDNVLSKYRPATDEEIHWAKVRSDLERPIYDEFGSFAGEFYVYGTVVWDITKGTHEMHGGQSYTSWESF